MTNKNLKKKIISALMIGSVITSLGVTSFASTTNQGQNKQIVNQNKEKGLGCMENKNVQSQMEQQLKKSEIFTDSEIQNIKTYLESKKTEMQKDRQSMRNKTEEQRKTYFEARKEKREQMINGLVTEKIITQAQLDKLKEIMPQPQMRGEHKMKGQGNCNGQGKDNGMGKNGNKMKNKVNEMNKSNRQNNK